MDQNLTSSQSLAAAITKAASKQTYYTIRYFVDRGRVGHAYQAYGYFRWVDDVLDAESGTKPEKLAFAARQNALLAACYRGEAPANAGPEEEMLIDLVRSDPDPHSGLHAYLHNMMDVMIFDAERRGRVISEAELSNYALKLATAVTEAMHYFIGHDNPAPQCESRYLAVTAAHITHMLRDTLEDAHSGYFNVPEEYLQKKGLAPWDVENRAYQAWVCERVCLAREYFRQGRKYLAQVKNLRCRLAGFAYTARFEWVLHTIERDHYCLRSEYPERKGLWASLWMGWSTIASLFIYPDKSQSL